MKWLYSPPAAIRRIYKNFYWESKVDKILLTFDDGPIPETTESILKILSDLKIRALFFCVGENIEKYPSLAKEIVAEGHKIGNHTYNHADLLFARKEYLREQVNKFETISKEVFGTGSTYFRPPKGRIPTLNRFYNSFDHKFIMWDLLTRDYKNDLNIVKFAVQNYLKKNSIVVLHDSVKSKNIIIDSIKIVAEYSEKSGFIFGEPSECLK